MSYVPIVLRGIGRVHGLRIVGLHVCHAIDARSHVHKFAFLQHFETNAFVFVRKNNLLNDFNHVAEIAQQVIPSNEQNIYFEPRSIQSRQ